MMGMSSRQKDLNFVFRVFEREVADCLTASMQREKKKRKFDGTKS